MTGHGHQLGHAVRTMTAVGCIISLALQNQRHAQKCCTVEMRAQQVQLSRSLILGGQICTNILSRCTAVELRSVAPGFVRAGCANKLLH